MAIIIELDVMLAKRKMKLNELAAAVGITAQNLSVLKSGRAKALRFSTLDRIIGKNYRKRIIGHPTELSDIQQNYRTSKD